MAGSKCQAGERNVIMPTSRSRWKRDSNSATGRWPESLIRGRQAAGLRRKMSHDEVICAGYGGSRSSITPISPPDPDLGEPAERRRGGRAAVFRTFPRQHLGQSFCPALAKLGPRSCRMP